MERRVISSKSTPARSAIPVERVRDEHPQDVSWRADALARSQHSRVSDHLLTPIESHDVERAKSICAEVCRTALEDFAPALILLPSDLRTRAQALTAYGLTLFDFAYQTGLEGERLSQINRWEFDLDLALSGKPPGQPVFVLLAEEHARQAWPTAALDRLVQAARRQVTRPRPATAKVVDSQVLELGRALATGLLGNQVNSGLDSLAAALLRVRALQNLHHALRRHQVQLPTDELPTDWTFSELASQRQLDAAVHREIDRIRLLLAEAAEVVSEAPSHAQRALNYLLLAGLRLLSEIEILGAAVAVQPPRLGVLSRIALLLRARFMRLR